VNIDTVDIVRVVGTILCLVGIVLAFRVGRRRFTNLSSDDLINVGNAKVSAAAFWKMLAFAAIVIFPLGAVTLANYHTFEGVHEVAACARCHVMRPMINDMRDPASQTLAARHFRNGWIPQNQCYECHSDYGLSGGMAAKAEGYRHLARYTTRTYPEPIAYKGHFPNDNCLKCHRGKTPFEAVKSHHTVRGLLEASTMSCLNCHGRPHPTRAARTPGSADYARLMQPAQ
jgi:trimethylamine-N-oxide reductase (cytochrome c), cytochrome c-type subunit TorC